MAYTDIQQLYEYYTEHPDPARADIHTLIKTFKYKGTNVYLDRSTWKDATGKHIIFEFDDGISKVQRRLYDTGEGTPVLTQHNVTITALQFYQAYNYAGHVRFNCYIGFSNRVEGCSLKTDVVRITNGVTEVIPNTEHTWNDVFGTTEISYGGGIIDIMGHAVDNNSLVLSGAVPFYDGGFANYQLVNVVGWSGNYPDDLSQFAYIEQARTRFAGECKSAINSFLHGLVTYDMSPLFVDGFITPITEDGGDGTGSYFYDCYTYSDNFAQTAKTLVYHKWGKIKTPTGCRVWGVIDNNLPYNVKLHATRGYEFMGAIQNDGTFTLMESDDLDVRITARKTVNDGNGVYYYGALSTNIPIFDNDSDGDHYGETGDDSTSIYDDVWNGSTTHRFGELITKTQTASYNLPSHGRPYYNVNTHIAELIGWISSERVQSIFADFTLWGNNPIDMVCDFYWTPLDLLTLGYTHSGPHFIQFGYIYAEDLTSSASEPYTKLTCNNAFHSLMGTEYTLVNEVISGVYNDWRDYELFKFKLYLPFMGTIDLPPHLIINKTLKVTIKYFISTHTLHYYIYVDNVVAYEYDVIVGCDVPLTGADVVGKARQNLSAYGADYGHFASMGASAVRGDFVGAVSSGIGLMTNKIMRDSATSLSTWGTQSVTGNICDYGSCYMVIEEQQHYAPPKLHDMYNYPSYYIGTIGSCSGYCEIENVKLSGMGSFSESEKNKVKELLRNGVIL